MDALYALYNRLRFSENDFQDVVGPMFRRETLTLLMQLYQWLQVNPADIDDSKYLMLKRLSEVGLSCSAMVKLSSEYGLLDSLQSWSTPLGATLEHA